MFDKLGDRDRPRQPANDVHVIDPSTSSSRETTRFLNVMAKQSEHFFPKFQILQERLTVLRAEDDMQPDLRQ